MNQDERFAQLRETLSQRTDENWQVLVRLLRKWPIHEGRDLALDYAQEHIKQEPDELRKASFEALRQMLENSANHLRSGFMPVGYERFARSEKWVLDWVTNDSFLCHARAIEQVAFTPDSRYAVTRSAYQTTLWDLLACHEIRTFPQGECFALTPDGQFIAFGDSLIDLASGKTVMSGLQKNGAKLNGYVNAISPDGQWLVKGSDGSAIELYDLNSGKRKKILRMGRAELLSQIDFSVDGQYLMVSASGGGFGRINIFNTSTWKRQSEFDVDTIYNAQFHPDGNRVLVGDFGSLGVFSWRSGELEKEIRWSGFGYFGISPGGRYVLGGIHGYAGEFDVGIWDVENGELVRRLGGQHPDSSNSLAFSPNGRLALIGGGGGIGHLWDLEANKELSSMWGRTFPEVVAISPDGNHLFSGGLDKKAHLHRCESGHILGSFETSGGVGCLAIGPNGKEVLVGGENQEICLWKPHLKRPSKQLMTFPGTMGNRGISSSPNARRMAVSFNYHKKMWVFERKTGHTLLELDIGVPRNQAHDFSPDGKFWAIGDESGRVHLYQTSDFSQPLRVYKSSDSSEITGLKFAPDSRMLVASRQNHPFWLINVASDELTELRDDKRPSVYRASFQWSRDLRWLYVWSDDEGWRTFDLLHHRRATETEQSENLDLLFCLNRDSERFDDLKDVAMAPNCRWFVVCTRKGLLLRYRRKEENGDSVDGM